MSNSYAAVHQAGFLAEVRASQTVVVTRLASPAALQRTLEKYARSSLGRNGDRFVTPCFSWLSVGFRAVRRACVGPNPRYNINWSAIRQMGRFAGLSVPGVIEQTAAATAAPYLPATIRFEHCRVSEGAACGRREEGTC
jgi:hypothetical protein